MLRTYRLLLPLVLFAAPLGLSGSLFTGCTTGTGDGDGDPDGGVGDGDGDGDGDADCPEGGGTVCDVQNTNSPNNVPQGETTTLSGVVATTGMFELSENLDAFFVSDDPPAFYGGVLVTVPNTAGVSVARGDILDLSGSVTEFSGMESAGSETQLAVFPDDGDSVTVTGSANIEPIDVSDISKVNSESAEGVLVRLTEVFVSDPDAGGGRFLIQDENSNEVQVGPSLYRYSPVAGEVLTEIVGVVRYNTFGAGVFELSPRDANDIESEGLTFPTKGIPQLRDPSAEGYVEECPFDQDCDPVMLEKMVVVSPTVVGARSDEEPYDPYLFKFYIADPNAVNADGELEPYSGIVVSIIPNAGVVRENSYTFGQTAEDGPYGDPEDNPGSADFPQIGDVVTVAGQNKPYFDFAQLDDVVVLRKEGTVDSVDDVTMPQPAQFDGDASALKGGRPAFSSNEYGSAAQDAVAPAADIEQWEGVLVQLNNVQTTDACYPVPYAPGGNADDAFLRDFGYWLVSGDAEIGTQFRGYFNPPFGGYWAGIMGSDPARNCDNLANKCADSRAVDQTFTSLTGVVNYSFEVWRVNPRGPDDIAPASLFVDDTCN